MTEDTGIFCVGENSQYLKNVADGENAEYIMAGSDKVIGIKQQGLLFLPDGNLPLGIIANTAAIMGITIGKQMPEVMGANVYDRTGNGHLGIIEFPVPILKGNVDVIKSIREKLYEPEFSDLTVVDFSDLAQGCKTYDEFIEKMKDVSVTELNYFGIAVCKPRQHGQRGVAYQLRGTGGLLHQLHQIPPGMGIRKCLYGRRD